MSVQENTRLKPRLGLGDHSPVFSCDDTDGNLFDFYVAVTGKPVVLIFCGDRDLKDLTESTLSKNLFDEDCVQVATLISGDASQALAQTQAANWPFRTIVDVDGEITSGFSELSGVPTPAIYVLDPNQRVVGITSINDAGDDLEAWLESRIREASYLVPPEPVSRAVPVLLVPRVLEPEDCEWLIGLWRDGEKHTGQVALGSSANDQKGVVQTMKRREDYVVKDAEVEQRILNRIMPRLVPEIKKILHFHHWEMEALRIGCYKAADSGFFNIHRDNCNPSVANRKFAITINLNTGDYEGGVLRFPEYGNELFEPPRGGAVVFSCSMLHEVLPVTAGERYTLLTFLKEPAM
jgi:predicted 2-oxoglutarate/Fe(II)-dependent dioxygenase YbiX